jgi:hypothetical protein
LQSPLLITPSFASLLPTANSPALSPVPLHNLQKSDTLKTRGNEMAAKVKPVQPTEIKDKKIAREVIEQIRKPIPASVYKRHEKKAAYIDKFFK